VETGIISNGKPVYSHSLGPSYLYFITSTGGGDDDDDLDDDDDNTQPPGYWEIDSNYGIDAGNFYAEDSAATPDLITAAWYAYIDSDWVKLGKWDMTVALADQTCMACSQGQYQPVAASNLSCIQCPPEAPITPSPGSVLPSECEAVNTNPRSWTELRAGVLASVGPITFNLPGLDFSSNYDQGIQVGTNLSISIMGNGAVLDAARQGSLFSVISGGSLHLADLSLQHALLPASSSYGGSALSVVGGGCSVSVVGVHFFQNEATGKDSNGGAVFIKEVPTDGGVGLLARFSSCLFEGNKAAYGGGVDLRDASSIFEQCVWRSNTATEQGGGLYANGASTIEGTPQTHLSNCAFNLNSAGGGGGGGAYLQYASPILAGCFWINNTALGLKGFGGGLELFGESKGGASAALLVNCTFKLNSAAADGGGTYVQDACPRFTECLWLSNTATPSGGGLSLVGESAGAAGVLPPQPAFTNCTFLLNTAGKSGGGTYIESASPSFRGCLWRNNNAAAGRISDSSATGGGMQLQGATSTATSATSKSTAQPAFLNCTFELNHADKGGGMMVQNFYPRFSSCLWLSNYCTRNGGGLLLIGYSKVAIGTVPQQPALTNCTFEFNHAGGNGGGTVFQACSPSFRACIWFSNTAQSSAGGLFLSMPSPVEQVPPSALHNCIFEKNSAPKAGGVYVESAIGVQFHAVLFMWNKASNGAGGGLLFHVTTSPAQTLVTFSDCLFQSNMAPLAGGGALSLHVSPHVTSGGESSIAALLPAVCSFSGTTLLNNTALTRGGAVEAIFPPDTPYNLQFVDGITCSGMVCQDPNSPPIHPTLLATNKPREWSRSVVLKLTGMALESNSALDGNGGGLAVTNGEVQMVDTHLAKNSAREHGGALYLDGTASVSASGTAWVHNSVNLDGLTSSADGQHVYAAAGSGQWNFSDSTAFEHADTASAGLSAAQTDGAHGLGSAHITCPLGAVVTKVAQRVSSFIAVSAEWSLKKGKTTSVTTNVYYDSSPDSPSKLCSWCQLPSNITTTDNTPCEDQYFDNYMCGNPPPIYPPMAYTTVHVGCKQCSRSEAALPAGGTNFTGSNCEKCPQEWVQSGAAKCDSGHVVQQSGWWRADEGGVVTNETKFWQCYTHEAACLGSANSSAGAPSFAGQCAEGHTGPVCSVCEANHVMVHSRCKKCTGGAWGAFGMAVTLAVVVAAITLGLYYYREKLGITRRLSAIKIIIGFYSLLAVLEQTFAVAWPAGFQRVLSNVKATFASVLDLSSFGCAISIDWFQKVGFWCVTLPLVLLIIAITFARALRKARTSAEAAAADGDADGTQQSLAQPTRKGKVSRLLDALFGTQRPSELDVEYSGKVFNVMLLIYPFLSPAVVAVFNCREVAGEWFLEADYSLHCFDRRWSWWAAVSALVCVFYVAGLPCLALLSVIRRSPSIEFISAGLRTDGGRIILGWEVVEMLRKFLLTSAVIFWPKGSCIQVAVAVMVSMFFLAFHMYHMPYDTQTDNWFQCVALVGLLLVYFMGLLIKVQPDLEQRYGFDNLLQIVTAVVGGIVVGVPIIHKVGNKWRQRGQASNNDNEGSSEWLRVPRDAWTKAPTSVHESEQGIEMHDTFLLCTDENGGDGEYHMMSDEQ
jgi:hypothetical protein